MATEATLISTISKQLGIGEYFTGTVDAGGSTTTVVDAVVGEPNDWLNGGYLYIVELAEERRVSDWVQSTHTFTVQNAFSSIPAAGNNYEYRKRVSREAISNALTLVLQAANEHGIEIEDVDTTKIFKEDCWEYALPTTIKKILWIDVESSSNIEDSGEVASYSSGTVTDTSKNWDVDKWIAYEYEWVCYNGTAAGERHAVLDSGSNWVSLGTSWTNTPVLDDVYQIRRVPRIHWDEQSIYNQTEGGNLRMRHLSSGYVGGRIAMHYKREPSAVTELPEGWVVPMALYHLFKWLTLDAAEASKPVYSAMANLYAAEAETARIKIPRKAPRVHFVRE